MKAQHISLTALSLLPILPISAKETNTDKPNIVMFLIDDLGWNDFSCYGSKFYQTPTIDSLANTGVMFTDAYAACTVSSPTRAALMTGKYPARLHLTDWISGWNYEWAKLKIPEWKKYLSLEEKTVAEYLKEAGYTTWHVGKWHLGDDEKYWPENQGFDINIGGNYKGAPIKNKQGCGGYFSPYCLPRLENGPEGEYLTDRLTNEAVQLIEQQGEEPFFLNMAHYAVHAPLGAKPEILKKYEVLTDSSYFQNNATYAAMISYFDEQIGQLIEKLKAEHLYENTLIVFTSDNGPTFNGGSDSPWFNSGGLFNSAYGWGKCFLHEGGIRVPAIITWPGKIKPGTQSDHICAFQDVMPTLAELAGITCPPTDGISFLPTLLGKKGKQKEHTYLYWEYPDPRIGNKAIRMGEWKGIITDIRKGNTQMQLYNLETDIREEHDVAAQHPDIVKRFERLMKEARNGPDF